MKPIVALVIGSLALFAVVAEAQDRPGAPRVAVLDWESSSTNRLEPFRQGLRDLGYVEGRNIVVDYRYAEQNVDRADALAAEIMQRPVTVIVAFATPAAHAAKKVSSTIPIVFASADPVGTGLVSNLARPGGNLTGVSNMMPDLESKRLELLHEILPNLNNVAFLGSTRDPAARNFVREAQVAAERIGIRFQPVLVGTPEENDGALASIARENVGAVIVQPIFALSSQSAAKVAELASRHRLPAISNYAHFARSGGLLSFGPHADFSLRAAAHYVDKILKGAKPGELPIQQPTKFELVINLKTAKALGLAVPPSLLARADEMIE